MIKDILRGAASGLVATVPMTSVMLWGHRKLPWLERYALPPRQITMMLAREAGIAHRLDEEAKTALTTAAHFTYGAAAGTIYGALCGRRNAGAATGAFFGAAVWTGSYLGLLPALGILTPATKHPFRRNLLMIGAHLVWGATLGESLRAMDSEGVDDSDAR
jgi:hypothetical protein